LRYSDEELAAWNLDEQSLTILRLDAQEGWLPLLPCAGCVHSLEQNEIFVLQDQLSTVALVGTIIEPVAGPASLPTIFMPLISP
jgi:hypothetical protein